MKSAVVLIPVKSFSLAKERLAGALDASERAQLARRMADTVARAAGDMPVAVVCRDPEVIEWALGIGAEVIADPGGGLNAAVAHGVTALSGRYERVVIAHGDLPLARDLPSIAHGAPVVIVPDRHGDGTNVLSVPADAGFTFVYGPGSFLGHLAVARRLALDVLIRHDTDLGWDIDYPEDLAELPRPVTEQP